MNRVGGVISSQYNLQKEVNHLGRVLKENGYHALHADFICSASVVVITAVSVVVTALMVLYSYRSTCLTSTPASVDGHTEPGVASVAIGVSVSTSPENDARSSDRAFSN